MSGNSKLVMALQKCEEAGIKGYSNAKGNIDKTARVIKNVSATLSNSLKFLDKSRGGSEDALDQLKIQYNTVLSNLKSLQLSSRGELRTKKKQLDQFSISLFGRTMTGKSTLMEILTQGDGSTIGNGSQRTTTDVRTYTWNGLKVTDVPGIAAFEGEIDEDHALKAAANADLVIFLISDDAPQPAEAECLAQLFDLGKPVIGICNVKISLNDEEDLELFLRNPDKPFDNSRLDEIFVQFNELMAEHIPNENMDFVAAHFHSKYLAQQTEYAKYRKKLSKASRFSKIEEKIIHEVINRGTFLRTKNFIDCGIVPMIKLSEVLLKHSEQNLKSGLVFEGKSEQFYNWSVDFKKKGIGRIKSRISVLVDDLREEIPEFSEDNYESKSVKKDWNKLIKNYGIEEEVSEELKSLDEECKNKLNEIARELKNEISLVVDFSLDHNIIQDSISDSKYILNLGIAIASAGLLVASFFVPVGWVVTGAVVVVGGLLSFFFKDREKKARIAREKLSKILNDHIGTIEKKIRKDANKWFNQNIFKKQITVQLNELNLLTKSLHDLAKFQRNLAWKLIENQKDQGNLLIRELLTKIESTDVVEKIVDVARIPGNATMLLVSPNYKLPRARLKKMENLLDERIWIVIDDKRPNSVLSQAIGKKFKDEDLCIDKKLRVARVPLDQLNAITKTRVRLAQQLTGLHILKK